MCDREKVIRGLEVCSTVQDLAPCPNECPYHKPDAVCYGTARLMQDALALLREQEEEQKRIVNWLGKFCSHVDQHFQPLPDEQNIEYFRQKMKQQFGWEVSGDAIT